MNLSIPTISSHEISGISLPEMAHKMKMSIAQTKAHLLDFKNIVGRGKRQVPIFPQAIIGMGSQI